ncbi:MAG: energy-coupling factor transporter transmembrane component T family protein [Eubacteriales bacterium]
MKSISLGQYYPADSIIHKLDGRTKILIAMIFIVSVFFCKSLASFVCLLAFTLVAALLSKIPFRILLRSLRAIIFILLFTFIINVFMTKGEGAPLIDWWIFSVYADGIWNAAFIAIRILCLILVSSIFISFTTTPIQLTYAIESLLSPLKKLNVPVHDFAMMMSIVLRFIPALSEEAEKIMNAQKARGADFASGSLLHRAKALIPILIPLFVSAFRRSDELATAMECRCYHGGSGRTRMTVTRMQLCDFAALFIVLLVVAALILLNYVNFGYVM